MNKRTIVIIVVGVMVLGMSGGVKISQAKPLEWHFYDARMTDGTYLEGHFLYDADDNTFSNWRIETFPGRLDGFRYTPVNSTINFRTDSGFDVFTVRERGGDWTLFVELLGAMTKRGGDLEINLSGSGETDPTGRKRWFEDDHDGVQKKPGIRTPQVVRLPRLPGCFISIITW